SCTTRSSGRSWPPPRRRPRERRGRMRRPGDIQSLAEIEVQRARNRAQVTRRLIGELRPYRAGLLAVGVMVLVIAIGQGLGPYLISVAIDQDMASGDGWGLLRTMLLLLFTYGIGALASRSSTRRVGEIGQKVLATLR